MRQFTSYGPVDPEQNYCVPRDELVEQCVGQLVGHPDKDKGGHYFTIWAARQTGKTWLMRKAAERIQARYGDRFIVAKLSAQGRMEQDDPPDQFLPLWPEMIKEALGFEPPTPADWKGLRQQLSRQAGVFERPLLLFIDEFDSLPPSTIDRLVANFRTIFLSREAYHLHGLALIGVRAVLGVDSPRGSPFNIQRSLRVPNLTEAEVTDMFRQYQEESGQVVQPEVVRTLFEMTRGQPGLVGWFGELLTEKYNPGLDRPITPETWQEVYAAACQIEPNNTMLNLLKKAKGPYLPQLMQVFSRVDVPFSFGEDWCNYLSLNGILDSQRITGPQGPLHVCRFSSPFVQQRLFIDLGGALLANAPILPLEITDTLSDVFIETGTHAGIHVPLLLQRYAAYLARLAAAGEDPFKDQPRRKDLRHSEAVGHFHLYQWLNLVAGQRCLVSPEFPTGNGTVDLVLRWQTHTAVIEVKSFIDQYRLKLGQEQAAGYAAKLGLVTATLAVFVPVPATEEKALQAVSGVRQIGGVTVTTTALSWTY